MARDRFDANRDDGDQPLTPSPEERCRLIAHDGEDTDVRRLVASAPLARPLPPGGPMVDVGEGAAEHAPQPCESDRTRWVP